MLILDTEWVSVLVSELVSTGLVSADLRRVFYGERALLPADSLPFVRAAIYPLLERGQVCMPETLLASRLWEFVATTPNPVIVYDSPHDRALCQFVLNGMDEVEPKGPEPSVIVWKHPDLDAARERWWREHHEHQSLRHHARVVVLALRHAWLTTSPSGRLQ